MEKFDEILEDIRFEVEHIGRELIPENKREVKIGMGNKNAPILFIGNDPNLYEDENFRVAVGSSGEFLVKLLDIAEITSDMYYITTLTKRDLKVKFFNEDDRKKLIDFLFMQLALIDPKIVVFLGLDIAQIVENREINFEEERGNFIHWRGNTKVLLTYEVEEIIKARADSGKKSVKATNFWTDIKNIKAELMKDE